MLKRVAGKRLEDERTRVDDEEEEEDWGGGGGVEGGHCWGAGSGRRDDKATGQHSRIVMHFLTQ